MKTNYPLDMSPADMADELAEYWYLQSSVSELLELARQELQSRYRTLAATSPKTIQERYFTMIGEHSDD